MREGNFERIEGFVEMKVGGHIQKYKPFYGRMLKYTTEFAERCYETNKEEYMKRNQGSPETIKKQIQMVAQDYFLIRLNGYWSRLKIDF